MFLKCFNYRLGCFCYLLILSFFFVPLIFSVAWLSSGGKLGIVVEPHSCCMQVGIGVLLVYVLW